MAFINWSEDYSVKIESIDIQHKKLVEMINRFYDDLKSKSNNELIGNLIADMKNYTVYHFTTEENLFKKYEFPEFETHKKEHDDFVNKVIDFEKRFKEGKMILSFEITDFLKKWLINHIQETDKNYSKFLKEKGVR